MRTIRGTAQWEKYIPGATDSHGNEIDDWEAPVDFGYWRFNPGGSQEPMEPGHDRVITQPVIYHPGPGLGAHDRVTVNGVRYPVDGHSAVWEGDNLAGDGCVTRLKRVEG